MKIFKKYNFDNQHQADELINDITIGDAVSVVRLKYTVIEKGVYALVDNIINEITPPVYNDKYCVDVLWSDESKIADTWSAYEWNGDNPYHDFAGFEWVKI